MEMPYRGIMIFSQRCRKGIDSGRIKKTLRILFTASGKALVITIDAANASVFRCAMGDRKLQFQYGDLLPVPYSLTLEGLKQDLGG